MEGIRRMLSIGQFAQLAKVSSRTLRHYESLGLMSASSRGDNQYRYYDEKLLDRVARIRDLQGLGFSLDEIKDVLRIAQPDFVQSLKKKLAEADDEMLSLTERRKRIQTVLSVSQKIDSGESINDVERNRYMDAIKSEILEGLKSRCGKVTSTQLDYLKRDQGVYGNQETAKLLEAVKSCVEFAKQRNLQLGPGRGSSPASMALYGLGFSSIDPSHYGLIPERLGSIAPEIHIDVEYERGQEFVDYCRDISKGLEVGNISAFKMPLLDILKGVHERLGKAPDYQAIDDDSDTVLNHFRIADIEKIFLFDQSEKALVMKYENLLPGYHGTDKITQYLRSQEIHSFRDVQNITSLWRPHSPEMLFRLERYRLAKQEPVSYSFLTPELRAALKPNFGLVIYHEDLLRVMAAYTGWTFERCNLLRRDLRLSPEAAQTDLAEMKRLVPAPVFQLILEETPWAFCQPHTAAFTQLTKQTAVLKSLHRDLYFSEIERWEQKHGFAWDDIGIRIKGVSLFQH